MKQLEKISCGNGIMDFYVEGKIIIIENPIDSIGKCKNKIIVTKNPSPDIFMLMKDCIGIITQNGGLTCHVALIGRELGIPSIVGANDILDLVDNEMSIAIESIAGKGIIYEIGEI